MRVYMCTFARVRERKGKARQGKGREGKREGHGTSEQHTSPELVKETCYVRSLIQSFSSINLPVELEASSLALLHHRCYLVHSTRIPNLLG